MSALQNKTRPKTKQVYPFSWSAATSTGVKEILVSVKFSVLKTVLDEADETVGRSSLRVGLSHCADGHPPLMARALT